MKFDCIIMNPPYDRSLHLKILAEAIKHLKDSESKVVNLSPVRWLQDPLAKFKKNSDFHKFEESVSKHIESLDIIENGDAQTTFGIALGTNLGLYECRETQSSFDVDTLIHSFVRRVLENNHLDEFVENEKSGYLVRVPYIVCSAGGHTGGKLLMESFGKLMWFKDGERNGKKWYECYTKNQHTKISEAIPQAIRFNSQLEAENFCKQYETKFAKVYTHFVKRDVNVSPMQILWMGNSLNPRTGKLGYESEWTDDDFRKFFGITESEWNTIETTMEKFK